MSNRVSTLCCSNCQASLDEQLPALPPTPVPHLFQKDAHHCVLSSKDADDIRQAIRTAQSRKSLVAERILQFEEAVKRWDSIREEHEEFIAVHKKILASARRLPDELWREVFQIASIRPSLPSWDGDWDFSLVFLSGAIRSAPLNISHVCRHWRDITRGTPSLWARIDFYIKQSFPSSKIQLLRAFLGRSRSHPLCIRVHLSRDISWRQLSQQVQENVKALVAMLSVHSERWESIDLRLYSEIYDNLGHFPIEEAPRLVTLFLGTQDCRQDDSWPPAFVSQAPLLSSFRCDNFLPSMAGFRAMIPWSNLRSVEFGLFRNNTWGFGTAHVVHVLSSCPHLRTFVMFGAFLTDEMSPVKHDVLEDVTLCSSQGMILAKLDFPGLKSLTLDQVRRIDARATCDFLCRCPHLKALRLHHSEKLSFLDFLPKDCAIEELEIILNDVQELMSNPPSTYQSLASLWPGHLPHLRSISISINFFPSPQDEHSAGLRLADAIHAMAARFTHLQRFRVEVDRSTMHPMAINRFRSLHELRIPNLHLTLV